MMKVLTVNQVNAICRRCPCDDCDSSKIRSGINRRRKKRSNNSLVERSKSSASLLLLCLLQLLLSGNNNLCTYLPSSVVFQSTIARTVTGFTPITVSLRLALYRQNHHQRTEEQSMTTKLCAKSGTKKKKKGPGSNIVAVNRVAYRNYEVLDTFESGISLLGTEVKSIRDGKLNLRDGYVKPSKNGRSCTLHNVHVGKCQYVGAEYFQHEEKRPRILLLHKSESRKLLQQTEQQGMTVIPLRAYWNEQNKLKVQIALCRGKNVRDKRATIQERDMKRETNRIIKNFRIG